MPTMAASVKSLWSCPKRSLDSALERDLDSWCKFFALYNQGGKGKVSLPIGTAAIHSVGGGQVLFSWKMSERTRHCFGVGRPSYLMMGPRMTDLNLMVPERTRPQTVHRFDQPGVPSIRHRDGCLEPSFDAISSHLQTTRIALALNGRETQSYLPAIHAEAPDTQDAV